MVAPNVQAFQGEEHRPFILSGGEDAIVLVHGFPGTPADMRPLGNVLNGVGLTVEAVLLPGFGAAIETLPDRTCEDWIAAIRQTLYKLQECHKRVFLLGHSMGGALSMQIAATHPTPPDGLILLAPFWKVNHILWRTLPVLKHIIPKPRIFRLIKLNFNDPETREGILQFMPEADLDDPETQKAIKDYPLPISMFAQVHRAGQIAYKLAPKITMPTLVIQAKGDELVQPPQTRQMIQRISGHTTYFEIEGKHNFHSPTNVDWDKITQAILGFVSASVAASQVATSQTELNAL